MKILVVATWYPSADKPTEAPFNAEHVDAIRRQGHDVRVIHARLGSAPAAGDRDGLWEGTPVLRTNADPRRPLSLLRTARTVARELRWADVVHTMAFSSILVAMAPWSGRTLTGRTTPWVHTEHWNGVVNPASVSPLWEKLSGLRAVLRLPHVVTGVTGQLAREMQRFARPDAAVVVPCVVEGPAEVRPAEYGSPLKLVAVGGLIPRKRPLTAIETVGWLRDQGFAAELNWVGDGPQRAECEALVSSLGLEEQVRFAGSVRPAEVAEQLSDADLFFLPTAQENFFTSAAEALAAGRAVVATRVGGFSDYAGPQNSRLVDDATPEALGRAILEAKDAFAEVPAEDIATPIRQRFSPEAVGELFQESYAAAVARA
ncbi:glycosyltransferase [Arthrobacter woluwensis]|uniref:Glycosyltransferase involved in cell wall bisynthesis n=1 Tax=Arthrobacter woluwensis TaxID=156980 RepID=A0A1H4MYY4_9MICC|nr:glycosyltransferase [Arthrobacter woluwensis]SEB87695.1 Glycosyltransferase involved in cell wall bisynthesis [Arthrobacter woluwensis]